MSANSPKEILINEYAKNLKCGSASLFIGSGLSRKANYSGWKDILRNCAREIGLDVEKEERNLITLAQYYIRVKQRTQITETIKEFFSDGNGTVQDVHRIIASLPVTNVWTTNYDTLIERAYEEEGISTTIITDDESYCNIDRAAKIKIHKIHGTVKTAGKCIIARQDYDLFPKTHDIVLSELKGEMCSNSFLFLGYSFSDTDIQHILTRIRLEYENQHPQRHFCIVEKVKRGINENEEDYEYRTILQNHYVADMQCYGITVVLVDSYDEIESILLSIRNKVYEKNILISGSYDDENQIASRISAITTGLVSSLVQKGYKILTGYGKNLGSNITDGAYDGWTKTNKKTKDFSNALQIFTFPFRRKKTKARDTLYSEIRERMVSLTKYTIIIAGTTNGRNAQGVLEEYKLSNSSNHLIIPIATTGGSARQVWDELNKIEKYRNNELFQLLAKEIDTNNIVKTVIDLIEDNREDLSYGA